MSVIVTGETFGPLGAGAHVKPIASSRLTYPTTSGALFVYLDADATAQSVQVRLVDEGGNEVMPWVSAVPGAWQDGDQYAIPTGGNVALFAEIQVVAAPNQGQTPPVPSLVVKIRTQ